MTIPNLIKRLKEMTIVGEHCYGIAPDDIKLLEMVILELEKARSQRNSNQRSGDKSLRIIEGLCELFENGPKDIKQAILIIESVYKIAHCHSKCENPHRDWWEERQKTFKELKKSGLI